jgi:hypothetical protein
MIGRPTQFVLVFAGLAAIATSAVLFVNHSGWTLYYGDAEAHLNIARRIVDSRTPGYDQIGTVWLPLPHVLMLPFVVNDGWWRNGLAGAIPSSAGFVLAGLFLFAAMRRATQSSLAAVASLAPLALNPNLLYLQATPMTEAVLFAGLMAILYFTVLFRQTQSLAAVAGAGIATLAACLTRYEGWFVIPFVAIYFLCAAKKRRIVVLLLFCAIASIGPAYWLAHNRWLYGNPLEFYNGPYSAKGIYQRALAQQMSRYRGDRDWAQAWLYFRTAAIACAGWTAAIVAGLGLIGIALKRVFWPLALAALPPIFYVWSMYSGGTPIFVPGLWPNTYYNTRYGLAALPLIAIASGGVALLAGKRLRPFAALVVIVASVAPWLVNPKPEQWICWKESQVNSEARREWTKEAAKTLSGAYKPGTGVFTSFGDMAGVYREAGIPLREVLHDGNEPAWMAATTRPDLFLHEEWVVAISGDSVDTAVLRARLKRGPRYHLVETIMLRNAPVIQIYKRD